MRLIGDIILFAVVAVGLGIGSAYFAVNHTDHLGLFQVGPWRAWPEAAGPDVNPYSKADQARRGSLHLASGEGIAFTATTDDEGTPLDGSCQYRISGEEMPSRVWTLSLFTRDNALVDNPSGRYSFHSQDVARVGGSRFEIVTGPSARGGDWLSSPVDAPFKLVLRLYETPHTRGGGYSEIKLPQIAWTSCQ
ncbi:DUF1214 domain-containing protein [uncultured Cohaesibacter sp.]|uniref:DUF1214 domain-containing protein n=1 Tax=uncultured Cohaesibacter sp. TaxID=1002546 RepID=UPI0029C8BCD5|nr:DUF1214 domain-containing protein [uncultured Cohaesibacter sp.]